MVGLGLLAVAGCHRRKPTPAPAPPVAAAPTKPRAHADSVAQAGRPRSRRARRCVYENGRRPPRDDRGGARGRFPRRRSRRRMGAVHPAGRRGRRREAERLPRDVRRRWRTSELNADGDPPRAGEHNLPRGVRHPAHAVRCWRRASRRTVVPAREDCVDAVDRQGLEQWTGDVIYLDRDRAKPRLRAGAAGRGLARQVDRARSRPPRSRLARDKAIEQVRADPKLRGRVDRYARGQARLRAVRAMQARMLCEGLLTAAEPLHARDVRPAVARGAGDLGAQARHLRLGLPRRRDAGDAAAAAARADAGRRSSAFLAERVADAAGIVEDGSINTLRRKNPPTWRDADGAVQPVPNLIDDHVNALLAAIGVATPEDVVAFLRAHKAPLSCAARRVQGAAAARVLPARRGEDADGPVRGDRSRRHLVRLPVRRARQADRAAARSLPAPDAVRELARRRRSRS